ncbi:hypothetical protein RJ55_02571 [Drechmeria coniospora]|nr:hypothetical protein RJ55_02571 [Drechmeria coniospora]
MRRNINATPQFIGALTELVWTQIGDSSPASLQRAARQRMQPDQGPTLTPRWKPENISIDLESFCNHAGRSTVTTDDVLLLARKNPDLRQLMEAFVEERKARRQGGPAGRRRS